MAYQNDEPERITSIPQLAAILRRLHDEHALLSVSFPGGKEIFTSAVLDVKPDQSLFLLDELSPRHGHEQVKPESILTVEARLQGVDVRFQAQVKELAEEDGIALYRAALPEYLLYRQRRQFHRVPVKLTLQHGISLAAAADKPVNARLTDMSVGGFGGVAAQNSNLVEGAIYTCHIQFPRQEPVTASVQIRFAKVDSVRRQQRFGAMFVDLSPQDSRRIQRIVMDLERELRRGV